MAEQVITFIVTAGDLQQALTQAQGQINCWLEQHPHAEVNTIDTELVPREHNAGEWVYVVTIAVRVPDAQRR